MERVVICEALRTPIGKFLGGLASVPAPALAAGLCKTIIAKTKIDPGVVDEVILGNVLQAGLGQNPARQAAIHAGIPPAVGAVTVNKVCGSGMKAVMLATQAIKLGDASVILAGGMENMSRAPYYLSSARTGQRLGHGSMVDGMVHDGLWDIYNDFHMGNTGELVAEKYNVTREDQDKYALESQRKAVRAQEEGDFDDEIVPVSIPQKKGDPIMLAADEGPRKDTTLEKLAQLKPAFKKDGTVTPGNASTINDGAAVLLVTTESKAKELGLDVLAVIEDYAVGGVEPEWVMMAPLIAVGKLLEKTGKKIDDFDLIELNEAFSAQAVAVTRELKMPLDRVNVNGGAVALGHPIGATGARILVTLINAMRKRGAKTGLATLCLGGGNATAVNISM
ncbi:MAG: acetyl-CoA C-acyltransferase [Candidatus Latescibacteria bacterium]|nr:acetyl-CoA C-acyltransferase [Candidatus Latescibacterota bacterium]NIM22126.1 acetyl-CoA C-acyltransferase [Candidatus Latescibacterota bacterium]NIM64676.1 acetyl-CoA C-acyltransferase [Candidatus Latescibacterota bacterium]NIO01186.1 acetyl-CoA C-acyltransferase [Candidatus Latescibacterota bacterium]NIO27571.1 acetyl-CoA C-acyltransferase [Candidatus Latescibacterota bacterium]